MSDAATILITGGAGYIGIHCIISLVKAGYKPIIADNMYNASSGLFQKLLSNIRLHLVHSESALLLQSSYDGSILMISGAMKAAEKITGISIPFYEIDVLDRDSLVKVFQEVCEPVNRSALMPVTCDGCRSFVSLQNDIFAVIHMAALKAVGESCEQPLRYYHVNVSGTVVLMQVIILFSPSLPPSLSLSLPHPLTPSLHLCHATSLVHHFQNFSSVIISSCGKIIFI